MCSSDLTQPRLHWMTLLEQNDVPFAPVNDTAEVCADPQVQHLGTLCPTSHPTEGKMVGIRNPVRFDGERPDVIPAPTLGEHTAGILTELGFDAKAQEALKQSGAL